jgi:hypothetical protein
MNATQTEMTVNFQPLSMDVIIVHAPTASLASAHEAARGVRGVRLLSTFRDGWGRVVTMAIASNVK